MRHEPERKITEGGTHDGRPEWQLNEPGEQLLIRALSTVAHSLKNVHSARFFCRTVRQTAVATGLDHAFMGKKENSLPDEVNLDDLANQ